MKSFFAILLFWLPIPGLACLHFDANYLGSLQEGTKVAFLFHDGINAHLVVRTDISAKEGLLPKEMAWVMPFPSLPVKYEEVAPEIFTELNGLLMPAQKRLRGGTLAFRDGADFVVHDTKIVGDYRIQPIEITRATDGKELSAWLAKNRYNPMPLDLQKGYLKKGAAFLAIRTLLSGNKAMLKPIHIVYPATELAFPLKFTHDSRVFNIDLFTFTSNVLSKELLEKSHLTQVSSKELATDSLELAAIKELKKLIGGRSGFLTKFEGRDLNAVGKRLRSVKADPTVPF